MLRDKELDTTTLAEERTVLAAERTFSAWLRTALAAMVVGLAILRLMSFKTDLHRILAHIIGELLIFWGFLLIVLSAIDYKKTQQRIITAKSFKSSYWGFVIIVSPLLIISVLLIWVILP
jgi:putative membrane protein